MDCMEAFKCNLCQNYFDNSSIVFTQCCLKVYCNLCISPIHNFTCSYQLGKYNFLLYIFKNRNKLLAKLMTNY